MARPSPHVLLLLLLLVSSLCLGGKSKKTNKNCNDRGGKTGCAEKGHDYQSDGGTEYMSKESNEDSDTDNIYENYDSNDPESFSTAIKGTLYI